MNYLNLSELHSFQLRNGAIIYQIDPGVGDGQGGLIHGVQKSRTPLSG